jgi:hypothetical protein
MIKRHKLDRTMRWGKEADSEPVRAFKERCATLSEIGTPLAMLARGAQPPCLQLLFFGAAPLRSGEPANHTKPHCLPFFHTLLVPHHCDRRVL